MNMKKMTFILPIKSLSVFIVLQSVFSGGIAAAAENKPLVPFLNLLLADKGNSTPGPLVGTVTSAGQVWMDRNLGASQVAVSSTDTAAYGDLYQWGRGADGHQLRTSPTTSTPSSTDVPGHGSFITTNTSPNDWRVPQNNSLWQGVTGTNNPCPAGFRLPTETEVEIERASWPTNNASGAFESPLKLTVAGSRIPSGALYNGDISGYYWSSSIYGSNSRTLYFGDISDDAGIGDHYRIRGFSVRCIQD
jgi:uncharacterized protein (TIGR02145 family)